MNVSLTEEMILNPDAIHERLRGWRVYRIEYGGPNEDCIWEGRIMLPETADPDLFEIFMEKLQEHCDG